MPASPVLEGTHVRLEPLSHAHVDGLLAAAGGDRSSFTYTWVPDGRDDVVDYVDRALAHAAAGDQVPFATVSSALGRVVGSTRFYELDPWDWSGAPGGVPAGPAAAVLGRASVGHTWLDPAAQRSPVNTEAKLLMFDHAFGVWGVRAVRLQTDARNARSRAAIERVGCTLDGVLRADRPAADGTVRDSAVFSLLAEEWPDARARLVARLSR
jgi:N-acetyltransferase